MQGAEEDAGPRVTRLAHPLVDGPDRIVLWIEEIAYEALLEYEPLYDLERLPVRFEADVDADWEYLDHRFHVAYAGDQPVGFTGMALTRRRLGSGPKSIYLRSSYTLPEYRHKGVWRVLWAHKLEEIARLGWATAETEIWGLTREEDLRYERRGFTLEGTVLHRYEGKAERFFVWVASWSRVLEHPANRIGLENHVLLHP